MSKVKIKLKATKKQIKEARNFLMLKMGPLYEDAIRDSILKGISPVKGQGRFVKYSESYQDQIKNKVAFRTINGKVIPLGQNVTAKELKDFRGSKAAKAENKRNKSIAKELNKKLIQAGKRIRPVNLKVTGKLLKSLSWELEGKFLILKFGNIIADYHNRLGAGKSKTIRRMLPTRRNEVFNRVIDKKVRDALKRYAKKLF
jgi:hypothetical protein